MSILKKTWQAFLGLKKWQKAVVLILLLSIVGAVSGGSEGTTSTESVTPKEETVEAKLASFEGELKTWDALNPASGVATFSVTNTGDAPGIPECKIEVQDSSRNYRGYDWPIFEEELAPGETINGNITLTVTKEGAFYVTQGAVTCD